MRRVEILLIGNTDFVTKQWIEHAFPHDKVVVALRKGTESSGETLSHPLPHFAQHIFHQIRFFPYLSVPFHFSRTTNY